MAPRQVISKVVKDLLTLKKNQKFKRPLEKIPKSLVLKPLYLDTKPQKTLFSTELTKFMKLRLSHKLEGRPSKEILKFKPVVTPVQLEADLKQYVKQHLDETRPSRRCADRTRVNLETIEDIMTRIQRLSLESRMERFGSLECIMTGLQRLSLDYNESMIVDKFGSMECILTEIHKLSLDSCDEGTLMNKFGSLECIMEEIKKLTV